MRQSNVCNPVQNQACIVINSRLYDRRGLDCTSPVPLFNSLAHLVHLTATSPKIREILTRDGGLERLVRILRDFCNKPPPAQDPSLFYGLLPPWKGDDETPVLEKGRPVDREAAQRFSLAFQSIVNIGVRGSESVRTRVVQAGTLEVVAALLETWLLAKGFPLALPPRRPRRRDQQQQLQQLPQQSQAIVHPLSLLSDATGTPDEEHGQGGYEYAHHQHPSSRAQFIRTRMPSLPQPPRVQETAPSGHPLNQHPAIVMPTPIPAASRGESVNRPPLPNHDSSNVASGSTLPTPTDTPAPPPASTINYTPTDGPIPGQAPQQRGRSGTIIPRQNADMSISRDHSADRRDQSGQNTEDSDADMDGPSADTDTQAEQQEDRGTERGERSNLAQVRAQVAVAMPEPDMERRAGDMEVDVMAAVNMVMTVDGVEAFTGTQFGGETANAAAAAAAAAATVAGTMPDETPRAVLRTIADATASADDEEGGDATGNGGGANGATTIPRSPSQPNNAASIAANTRARIRIVAGDAGPFRQEDVLRALQLLAYLTKYPHVRQEFYKPRSTPKPPPWLTLPPNAPPIPPENTPTTLFSLVERFTFRPSLSQFSQHPSLIIPTIPPEIQSWAAVIMRNACRKDESRGGIRQCANMTCGKWESAPREFAKCRRCRKAKYCGKDCQSKAWSMGHRYWCSAREGEEGEPENAGEEGEGGTRRSGGSGTAQANANGPAPTRSVQPQPQLHPVVNEMRRPGANQPTPGPSANPGSPPNGTNAAWRGTGGRLVARMGESLRSLAPGPTQQQPHQRQPSLPPAQTSASTSANFIQHLAQVAQQQIQHQQPLRSAPPATTAENEPGSSNGRSSGRWSAFFGGRERSGSQPRASATNASSSTVNAGLSRSTNGGGEGHRSGSDDRTTTQADWFPGSPTGPTRRQTDPESVPRTSPSTTADLPGILRHNLVIQAQQPPRTSHPQPSTATSVAAGPTGVPSTLRPASNLYPPNPPWMQGRDVVNGHGDAAMDWQGPDDG